MRPVWRFSIGGPSRGGRWGVRRSAYGSMGRAAGRGRLDLGGRGLVPTVCVADPQIAASIRSVDFPGRHVVGPGGPHARNCGAPRPSHRRPSCRRRPRPGLQPSRRRSGWPRPARGCARGMRGLGASGAHAPPRSTGRMPRVAAPARRAAAAHRRLRARGSHPLWHVLEVAKVQASACASHHAPYFLFTVFDGSCAPTSSTCSPPSWCSTMTTTTRSPSPRLPPRLAVGAVARAGRAALEVLDRLLL